MCAEEAEPYAISQEDRNTINDAAGSLAALLQDPLSPSAHSAAVTSAQQALKNLRNQLIVAHEARKHLEREKKTYEQTITSSNASQKRVEQDIIKAKLLSGELLTIRDKVAHDLVRVKKELQNTEALMETGVSGAVANGANDPSANGDGALIPDTTGGEAPEEGATLRDTSKSSEEKLFGGLDSEQLKRIVEEEMEQLKIAEKELMSIVDESSVIKKRREELERKMRIAQEE